MVKKPFLVVGVSGGIAAFKSVQLVSDLLKAGYDVEVIMTQNATEFVTPLTFSSLTKRKTHVDTFERVQDWNVEHIALAKKADLFVVAPATANVIGKFANGIADDFLSTTYLAMRCPVLIAPAMNTQMFEHIAVQRNMEQLQLDGVHFVDPITGLLACNDVGKGKMADPATIIDRIAYLLSEKPLRGKRIAISAGPTLEYLDPVRYLSNPSTGKMGYAIAKMARNMGADVTLVKGAVALEDLWGVTTISTVSAQDMFDYFQANMHHFDFLIKTAAVADYRAAVKAPHKIKKKEDTLQLAFIKNPDILAYLGAHKTKQQVVCGFAMESEHLIEHARMKKEAKHADLIVANNIFEAGAGFATDTNKVTFIDHTITSMPLLTKDEVAKELLMRMLAIAKEKAAC